MYSPTCRVCSLSHKTGNLTDIFQYYKFYKGHLEIYKVITDCASVQIEKDDGYSQVICKECLNHLCQAYSFKQLCEECDNKMRKKPVAKSSNKTTEKAANDEINKTIDTASPEIKEEATNETEIYEIKNEVIEEDTKIIYGSLEPQSTSAVQQMHSETEQFKCDLCNIKFKKAESLIIHKKVHTKCDVCYQSFKVMKDLQEHKNIHFKTEPDVAKIPNKSFTPRLIKRAKMQTPPIRFKCDICNLLCTNLSQLSQHRGTHDATHSPEECLAPKVKIKRIR